MFKNKFLCSVKKDFDLYRKIVLVQNLYSYNDDYINPELKKELEEAKKLQEGNDKIVDIEEQEVALSIISPMSMEEIRELPIRKFSMFMHMSEKITNYKILKTASMSGFVEFKQPIKHYLVDDNEEIPDTIIDYDAFKNKVEKT